MHLYRRGSVPASTVDYFRPAMIAAAVATSLVAAAVLWQDISVMQQQAAHLRTENVQLADLQRSIDKEKRAQQQTNKILQQGAPSQTAIAALKRVEAAWDDDISLLRMQTDMNKGRMQLHVSATSSEALFGFVDRLKQQFGNDVFLQQHVQKEIVTDAWLLDASLVLGWK
ncbi:hypothetical protein [Glaciimonas sp. PCH181]|uniref:hypothetical protein n=1 Tax=Glaciimonas sp. PCH181 TaxID=2133943 RepID=UPI000D3A5A6A|nr:hypothetical protein [Glaciimonas sp. PCH181]PUA18839.1 hypothetical protein C7W93_02685 [Glaciimonas sp. PCH181]